MQQNLTRAAWERFLIEGKPPIGIPPSVASSWERSRKGGMDTSLRHAPLAGEPEIHRRRTANAALFTAARPALERSRLFLAEAAAMMVLTDADGFIVETAGDPRIIDNGRRNHLEVGGRWDEDVIGTNAIGTALVAGNAIEIRGAEHFCEDVQRWTCAATPIRHPVGGIVLGVVDISGPMQSFNPQSLALAVSIGQEIEASLGRMAKAEHELLLRQFVSKRSVWLSESIVVVDRHGHIVHAAEHADKPAEPGQESLATELRRLIGSSGHETWERNCQHLFPNASMEIVRSEGEAIGCVIVMHRGRRRASPSPSIASPPPKTVEPAIRFDDLIGACPAMQEARERARKLAGNNLPILIEGETGVGKELFARAIKNCGAVADGPFVPLNCGGMPRDLIASELFGYVKGAFTGADQNGHAGRIEQADDGVLCLDEIGEMPLDLQAYLLRVLEDGIVYRIGDHTGRRVNVRILSMTNRDLTAEVEAGRFRRDLYYRIAAARLRIPPLRERGGDILDLARNFAATAARRQCKPVPDFTPGLAQWLKTYDWPGNVRELRNLIDVMISLSDTSLLDLKDIPPESIGAPGRRTTSDLNSGSGTNAPLSDRSDTKSKLRAAERTAILTQVTASGGNLTQAARRLGIARSTLYSKLAEYRSEEAENLS